MQVFGFFGVRAKEHIAPTKMWRAKKWSLGTILQYHFSVLSSIKSKLYLSHLSKDFKSYEAAPATGPPFAAILLAHRQDQTCFNVYYIKLS